MYLNQIPALAFLEKNFVNWDGKRGARIRTIRLRKQLSQGLLLPLKDFPEIKGQLCETPEGYIDFSELLNVEKWERALAANLAGMARGNFPSFIPKTDEERIQNLPNVLEKYVGESFEETIKIDGSSCTMYYLVPGSKYLPEGEEFEAGRFSVCSRNLDLKETEGNAFWQVAREIGIEEKLRIHPISYAIQGELVGPTIQKNYEKMGANDFYVYKIFNIDTQEFLTPIARRIFCTLLGLKHVVVLDKHCVLTDKFKNQSDILAYAEGPGMNPGVKREGVVFKHNGSNFSFKAISNSYLLKEE